MFEKLDAITPAFTEATLMFDGDGLMLTSATVSDASAADWTLAAFLFSCLL